LGMNCSFCARAGAWSAVVATRAANAVPTGFRFIGSSLEPSKGDGEAGPGHPPLGSRGPARLRTVTLYLSTLRCPARRPHRFDPASNARQRSCASKSGFQRISAGSARCRIKATRVIADAICFNAHFAIRLRAWHQYPDAPPTASRSRRTIADLGASGIGRIEAKSISPATAKPGPPSEPRRNFPLVMRRRAGPACFV
jgi:hypothetical protein